MQSWQRLFYYYQQIYLKRILPHTHLQTFVDQQPKQQPTFAFFENFKIAIVIKMLFHVSA